MKKILLLVLLTGVAVSLRAQYLTPYVVSTSGAFFSNGAGMLSTTVGELAAVTTLSGGSNYLTQGFQQPWDFSTYIPEVDQTGLAFYVYPNPSSGNFTIALNTKTDSKVMIKVHDILGKTIFFQNADHLSGFASYDISLKNVSEGVYFLEVINQEVSTGKTITNTRKITIAY